VKSDRAILRRLICTTCWFEPLILRLRGPAHPRRMTSFNSRADALTKLRRAETIEVKQSELAVASLCDLPAEWGRSADRRIIIDN
jgi:hypothetical protein